MLSWAGLARPGAEADMAEFGLAILILGVLVVADPERLQAVMDRVRDLMNWLAE